VRGGKGSRDSLPCLAHGLDKNDENKVLLGNFKEEKKVGRGEKIRHMPGSQVTCVGRKGGDRKDTLSGHSRGGESRLLHEPIGSSCLRFLHTAKEPPSKGNGEKGGVGEEDELSGGPVIHLSKPV